MIEKINKNKLFLFFALIILILWQALLPGYILTLDTVWSNNVDYTVDSSFNLLPLNYLLTFLDAILPGWIVQKLLIIFLFLLLFYLPFRFFPWPERKDARLWFSLFFVFNPFVYE